MKKNTIAVFTAICAAFLFSCQNDLSNATEEVDPISVSQRATPEDAIDLKPDANGKLVLEGGKNYVIRGEVSATGFSGNTSTSNYAQLYIEGTLYLDYLEAGADMVFPNGLLITISDGGILRIYHRLVTLGSVCSIYIQKGGLLDMQEGTMRYRDDATESSIINYGRVSMSHLSMFNIPFYNMPDGIVVICAFFSSGEVTNMGVWNNCDEW